MIFLINFKYSILGQYLEIDLICFEIIYCECYCEYKGGSEQEEHIVAIRTFDCHRKKCQDMGLRFEKQLDATMYNHESETENEPLLAPRLKRMRIQVAEGPRGLNKISGKVVSQIKKLHEKSRQPFRRSLGVQSTSFRSTNYRSKGSRSTGSRSTGSRSMGYRSTGYRSTGYRSTGYKSMDYRNMGYRSTGYRSTTTEYLTAKSSSQNFV